MLDHSGTTTGGQRGRKAGFRMSSEHRVKIQNSNILNALIEHVEGVRDMSPTHLESHPTVTANGCKPDSSVPMVARVARKIW